MAPPAPPSFTPLRVYSLNVLPHFGVLKVPTLSHLCSGETNTCVLPSLAVPGVACIL